MARSVRVVPATPVPPAVPVVRHAPRLIVLPADTKFIKINDRRLSYYYDMNK